MPRRNAPRCGRRTVAANSLDQLVEHNLCHGDCFGFADLTTRAEFARPWAMFGEEITARWIEAFPGSRPMAAYILGEIEPPPWAHDLPALRHPLRPIRGVEIVMPDTAWHRRLPEVEHLAALGLLDDQEHEAAIERLDNADRIDPPRYRPLAAAPELQRVID
jgi:hypothetical protein